MKHTLLYLYITILVTFFCCMSTFAQEQDPMDVTIHVSTQQKGSDKPLRQKIQYAFFRTPQKANEICAKLQVALKKMNGTDTEMADLSAWDRVVNETKIKFYKSAGNGDVSEHIPFSGSAFLICTYMKDRDWEIADAQCEVVTMVAGKTEYDVVFKRGMNSTQDLDEVVKYGQADSITIKPAAVWDDGKNLNFRIHISLPEGYGSEEGRMIVQPMAVECRTEDTVAYIPGIVMEGEKYHRVQNRIMMFDYMKNDKISYAYIPDRMWADEKILLDKAMSYPKPNVKETYKVPYLIEIADMNHIYYRNMVAQGSCNSKKIFKFLELGLSAADMDISEFRIDAKSQYSSKNTDLRLIFKANSSELTSDSTNQVQLKALADELRQYGEKLVSVKIEATSSPEGGYEKNVRLAKERTDIAERRVNGYIGRGNDVHFTKAPARVCTWDDVAKQVEAKGNTELATKIRESMGENGYGGDAVIMNLPEYPTEIQPIVESLRMMRVTYSYEREHVMDLNEVQQAYYVRKHSLLHNRTKDFSDGDYYNLFRVIKDSAEQDTVTMLAYKHVVSQPAYWNIKFSMYVANRMAMLNLRNGKPDVEVLRPFINPTIKKVEKADANSEDAQVNRREILINQIITYFQLEQRDTALSYLDGWFAKDTDPKVSRLKQFVTFKEYFIRNYTRHDLSAEQEKRFKEAEEFVFSCAKDNKAVIYAEAHELLNKSISEADTLVMRMDDDNPKKWYLKGILAAQKEEEQTDALHDRGYLPDYLAYFHQAFLMNPSYKLLYFNEGQVSDELRDKYHYRRKDYPTYVTMFRELVGEIDTEGRVTKTERGGLQISADDEDEDGAENDAPATE